MRYVSHSVSSGTFCNTGQCYRYHLNRLFSHVPSLIREVTALRLDV